MTTLPKNRDGEFLGRKNTKHGTASLELLFFPCDSCEESFTDKKEMKQHVISSHRSIKDKNRQRQQMSLRKIVQCCKTCGKEFNNLCLLKKHQNTHKHIKHAAYFLKTDNHSRYSVCPRSNGNANSTRETKDEHASNSSTQFICNDGGKVFNRSGFFKHGKSHTKDIQQPTKHQGGCVVCGRAFRNQRLLTKHNQLHHQKKVSKRASDSLPRVENKNILRCCECDRFFENESIFHSHKCFHLRKHLRKFIAAERQCKTEDIFYCQLCIVTLTSGLDLEVHIKDIHPEQYTKIVESLVKLNSRHGIPKQDNISSTKDIEKVNINIEEQEDEPGPYMCKACGKHVKDHNALRRHAENHIKTAQKHRCKVCGKAFGRKDHLKRHSQLHYVSTSTSVYAVEFKNPEHILLENNHVCLECGNKFELEEDLLLHHELAHPGPEGYTCHHCTKTFSNAQGLRRHRRCHSTKRHSCLQCGKKFGRLDHLQRHEVVHTKKKTSL